MSEGSILNLIGAWTASLTGIAILFKAMEYTTPKDKKRSAANWLKSIADKSTSNTIIDSPQWFVESFDRIFGAKHLTIQCFLKSCMASIIAVVFMTIIWALSDFTSFVAFFDFGVTAIFFIFIWVIFLNFIPDFISLLETRWILNSFENIGLIKMSGLLLIDIIITGIIFAFGLWIYLFIFESTTKYVNALIMFIQFKPMYVGYINGGINGGIFFYSTFFTSVWLYLFIISSIGAKVIYSFGHFGNTIMDFFGVQKTPFQSMGTIAMILVTVCFVIYAVINLIG